MSIDDIHVLYEGAVANDDGGDIFHIHCLVWNGKEISVIGCIYCSCIYFVLSM